MKLCRLILPVLIPILFVFSAQAQLTYKELRVLYDSTWTFKNLQLIPIKFKPKSDGPGAIGVTKNPPVSLSEAMQNRKVKVQEMQYKNGADVNWLQVTNHSKQDILVQSGEIVEGGKQDRMLGETKIISAGSTDYLHVYCVEKRRWDDKPKTFKNKGVANSEVRKAMDVTGRQSDVWKEIDKEFAVQKKESRTWSYLDLYNNNLPVDTSYLQYFTHRYRNGDDNYAGFIFITGNRILSTEIFASPALLDISFTNMLNSYIQTAITSGSRPAVSTATTKDFMDKVLLNEEVQKIFVTAHGKLNRSGGKVIHLVAYPD